MTKKATGYVTYDVSVECPHCKKKLQLNQYPYTDEEHELAPCEDELGAAVFGFVDKPATWKGFQIEYKCCGCKNSFVLTDLET